MQRLHDALTASAVGTGVYTLCGIPIPTVASILSIIWVSLLIIEKLVEFFFKIRDKYKQKSCTEIPEFEGHKDHTDKE